MANNSYISQLSALEKANVAKAVKEELVEHWFKEALPGAIIAFFASCAFYVLFYSPKNFLALNIWLSGFLITLALIVFLDFQYKHAKEKLRSNTWNICLSVLVVICTLFWGSSILFNPNNIAQLFILLAFLFMTAASFSMVTVGMFYLGALCVSCILLPVSVWLLLDHDFYYKIGGGSVLIYISFLLTMNRKSTQWLKSSLELSRILSSTTHQANYDILTDLPNQRLLSQYIQDTIKTVSEKNQNFCVISFGINRLELFNTTLGYHAGDLVVQSVAKRLEAEISELNRKEDVNRILTKPRADAFVILISPLEKTDINKEINYLFLALNKPFYLGNRESHLTGSVGVSIFPQDTKDPEKILTHTYAAMFEAKAKGGNQIAFYKPDMVQHIPHLLELETDLDKAIAKKQFEVYYQPLIDLRNKSVAGMEALIRWHHPTKGMVSPLDFIPVAEETSLILPIGEWVLNEASRQTVLWHQQGFKDLKIAINISAKQLRQGNLIETIDNMLEKTKLDPSCLELELTETALLDDSLVTLINHLSRKGISLAIDDFGTGYSGLSYLKHFHIDKIKIDQSFIRDVTTNNDSAAIVTATLAMAKELGIKTLAEGVETKEQLQFLQERDCQYVQGFYFSRPLEAKALTQFLTDDLSRQFI